jgi:transcriptional regulator with XRE-family HTH domain
MDIHKYISTKIKELRETYAAKGLSQEELAGKVGVTPNTISRWETGEYKPKITDLQKLAKFFGKPIYVFLPETHQPDDTKLSALFSATADLKDEDIQAVTEFAEFRKARSILKEAKKKKASDADD